MKPHRVMVSGMGIQCPLGRGVAEFSRRMFAGEAGVRHVRGTHLPEDFPIACAGVLDGPPIRSARQMLQLDLLSVSEALGGLPAGAPIDAIVYGNFSAFHLETAIQAYQQPSAIHAPDFGFESRADHFSSKIAEAVAERGHGRIGSENQICISSACATGTHAIGIAYESIRSGRWKRCLVVGSDWRPLESGILYLYNLMALSRSGEPAESVSRPFDRTRSGAVRSQGGGALLLEAFPGPGTGGPRALAEVAGFGITHDAFGITEGREDVSCLKRAMADAVSTAGLAPGRIDYVNAHGTSTEMNDRLETKAIKELFGRHASGLPVSSLKSQTGHTFVASGVIETIACVLMLERQVLAPTINYREPDPLCDLDYVPNSARPWKVEAVLKNSIGFGGVNASLVLKRARG